MRHGDPGVGGRGDRARDAGHDLERHARGDARLGFLATAAEHERVAALQAHDLLPGPPALDEQRVDLFLRHRGPARRLADVDALRAARARGRAAAATRAGRRRRRRRSRSSCLTAPGQQARVTGPGTDEVHGHCDDPLGVQRAHVHPPRRAARARLRRRALRGRRPTRRTQHDVRPSSDASRTRPARAPRRRPSRARRTAGRSRRRARRGTRARRATLRCASTSSIAASRSRVAASSARHSTPSAPCATCGSITAGSSTSATSSREAEPFERGERDDDRVEALRPPACAAGSRCCRATARTRDRAARARAARAGAPSPCRPRRRSGTSVERGADQRVARVGPFGDRREDQPVGGGRRAGPWPSAPRCRRDRRARPVALPSRTHPVRRCGGARSVWSASPCVCDEHVLDGVAEQRTDPLGLPAREPARRASRCASARTGSVGDGKSKSAPSASA